MTGIEYLKRRDLHPFWDGYSDPNREDVVEAYEQGKADGYNEGFDAGARRADSHPRWISVQDRLPNDYEEVLTCVGGHFPVIAFCLNKTTWYAAGFPKHAAVFTGQHHWQPLPSVVGVTHWMPLPAPPKKGGEE